MQSMRSTTMSVRAGVSIKSLSVADVGGLSMAEQAAANKPRKEVVGHKKTASIGLGIKIENAYRKTFE